MLPNIDYWFAPVVALVAVQRLGERGVPAARDGRFGGRAALGTLGDDVRVAASVLDAEFVVDHARGFGDAGGKVTLATG